VRRRRPALPLHVRLRQNPKQRRLPNLRQSNNPCLHSSPFTLLFIFCPNKLPILAHPHARPAAVAPPLEGGRTYTHSLAMLNSVCAHALQLIRLLPEIHLLPCTIRDVWGLKCGELKFALGSSIYHML
jgi:hypothetical protein